MECGPFDLDGHEADQIGLTLIICIWTTDYQVVASAGQALIGEFDPAKDERWRRNKTCKSNGTRGNLFRRTCVKRE